MPKTPHKLAAPRRPATPNKLATPRRLAPFASLATLALLWPGAHLPAQQESTSRPAEASSLRPWIDLAQSSDPRGAAFTRLLRAGKPAAEAVADAIDPKKPQNFEKLLLLLETMGPAATETLDTLWEKAEETEGEPRRRILDSILTLALHLDADGQSHISRAQSALNPMMLNKKDADQQQRNAETWFRAVQLSMLRDLSPEQLVKKSTQVRSHSFGCEMAMILLSYSTQRTTEQTRRAIEIATEQLQKEPHRGVVTTHSGGQRVKYPCGPQSNRHYATALLRMKPKPEVALEAHIYLLQHGLVHQQWRALNEIRQRQSVTQKKAGSEKKAGSGKTTGSGKKTDTKKKADTGKTTGSAKKAGSGKTTVTRKIDSALRAVAANRAADRTLRYEAVTTIGLLETISAKTQNVLRELSGSKDRAMAARAKAALRDKKR